MTPLYLLIYIVIPLDAVYENSLFISLTRSLTHLIFNNYLYNKVDFRLTYNLH